MIKFFRRIRERLLVEGRLGKYLLYAFGEIILVVIGILIALQLNTINNQAQDRRMERAYLTNFLQDLELNQQELERVIKKTGRVEQSARHLALMILDSIPRGSLIEIDSLIGATNGFTVFMSAEGTMGDIQGSGRLNLISSDSVRRSIATWEGDLKGIREWEKMSKDANVQSVNFLNQRVDQMLLLKTDTILTGEQVGTLFSDVYYRNLIYDIGRISHILNRLYRDRYDEINVLVALVNREIERLND